MKLSIWLIVALFAAPAFAQEGAFVEHSDGGADVQVLGESPAPGAAIIAPHADILRMAVQEVSLEQLSFRVELAGAPPTENPEFWELQIGFTRGQYQYRIVDEDLICDAPALYLLGDGLETHRLVECLEGGLERSTAIFSTLVARAVMTDENLQPLAIGQMLTDVYVTTYSGPANVGVISDLSVAGAVTTKDAGFRDRAPNSGGLTLEPILGGSRSDASPIILTPRATTAATNGLEADFLFLLQLEAPANLNVDLIASFDDPVLEVALPKTVTVPADGSLIVPVVATTTPGHRHGESAHVEIRAEFGSEWTTTTVAISWLEVPQPAGHHPFLYFHSRPDTSATEDPTYVGPPELWMNALEEDIEGGATDEPVPGILRGTTDGPEDFKIRNEWSLHLSPPLFIGLDFDLDRDAMLTAAFDFPRPADFSELTAALYYCGKQVGNNGEEPGCPSGWVRIAYGITPEQSVSGSHSFALPLSVADVADFLVQDAASKLRLDLTLLSSLDAQIPEVNPIKFVVSESLLELPLFEYSSLQAPSLDGTGIFITPESSSVIVDAITGQTFQFTIQNKGAQSVTMKPVVQGSMADWIRLPSTLKVPPGESSMQATIMVPDEARKTSGKAFIFLQDDDAFSSVATIFISADIDLDVTPEGQTEGKRSSAPGLALLLGVLGFVSARRKPM